MSQLYEIAKLEPVLKDRDVAHLVIDRDEVVSRNTVEGLTIDTKKIEDGVELNIVLEEGVRVSNKVHMCFGVLHKSAVQNIVMEIELEKNSSVSVIAECIFPNAVDVKHFMDARVTLKPGASYEYFERHIHSDYGGVEVRPKSVVTVEDGARFKTDFELVRGRVGLIDVDYDITCGKGATMEMDSRISGKGDDVIKIREKGALVGENSTGVLMSKIAVRDDARAEIYNELTATAAYARGHVDCFEIVQDNATAKAIPIIEVSHPKAHITHEAAIGSVDSRQLQTLMSRGIMEDDAVEMIIAGLLSKS